MSAGRWTLRLEVDEPESRVAVALDESATIVGLASAGIARDQDEPTSWELYLINVAADRLGSGLADDLMLAAAGDMDMTVWVLSRNARAQAFYVRHGFTVEGATKLHDGTGASEIRMVRRSGASDR
jgi:ribosomal protein S18 acetylase RimI-like enzyme